MLCSRRRFLKTTAIGLPALTGLTALNCEKKRLKPPNIIFILADDLGYGDLGCYGQKEIQTPHLDQMASEGMRFTRHYAGSTVCAPSRCCLMTGLHTGHAKVRGNARIPLDASDQTAAKLLKRAGYTTGLIGKWGLGEAGSSGHPNKQGFDTFFGYLNQIRAHNYYPDFLWRNTEKVLLKNKNVIAQSTYAKNVGSAATERNDYSHDLFSAEAQAFIQNNRNNPFFLYLAYTIPHANNEHWLVDKHGMEVPDYGTYQDKNWPEAQKGTAAMISRMDRDIGKLFSFLKQMDIDDNTIVFFSSDNGPHAEGLNDPEFFNSNGPLRGRKRDLYEGGIRVPLIVRWPGKIKAGSESDHISAFWDFLPTACELAGVEAKTDGLSMVAELTGRGRQKKHDYLYWEFFEKGGRQAVRMEDWKGVRYGMSENPEAPVELYCLSDDIGEQNNIADEHPDVAEKIKAIMTEARTSSAHFQFEFEKQG